MQLETEPQTRPSSTIESIPHGKGLLINRNFALLAIGQAISNIGDFVYSTTLLIWVFTLTHSAAAVSGVVLAQYAPIFIFGPIAGVFVDRWNRRTTMIITDTLRAIIALLPIIVPDVLRLPAIYGSVFLIAALSRFFTPAKSGVLQVIVAESQQGQASSISQATMALAFVVGPALASPLYFVVGPVAALLLNAVSYAVSAVSIWGIQSSRELLHPYAFRAEQLSEQQGIRAVLHELFAGFRFVVETRVLLLIVIMSLIAMLGAGALNALDIVFASRNLHASPELYGPLAAAAGIGTLIGAIAAGLLLKRIKAHYLLTGGVLLLGLGIVLYSFQTWYYAALIINLILCIPQGGLNVGFGPLLIAVTPPNMMGRTQSVIETSMFGISLISIGLAGYIGQFVSVSLIFAVSGALIALGGLFGWFTISYTLEKQQVKEQTHG